MKRLLFLAILLLISAFATLGAVLAQDEPAPMPTLDELADGWNMLMPGGETICARGTPYAFFVHRGDPAKLMVYFQGGGGCWNALTCSANGGTFDDSVSENEFDIYQGIFDFEQAANPFRDYTYVVVSYCSGDFHGGNAENTYTSALGEEVTVTHRGAVNTAAVLEWTYANLPAPDSLVIAGSSAGSIGAYFHAEHILDHYSAANPDLEALVFGDAGVGVSGETVGDPWGLGSALPDDPAFETGNMRSVMETLTRRLITLYPNVPIVAYSNAQDTVQVLFYELLNGQFPTGRRADAWEAAMRAHLAGMAEAPNYHYYIADGEQHTILAYPNFYTLDQNGTPLVDWLNAVLAGETVENVD